VIFETWVMTDVGKQRSSNEDSYYVDPENGLVLVLDGMGGHRAGEVASRLATDTISQFFRDHLADTCAASDSLPSYDKAFSHRTNVLRHAVFEANRVVLEESQASQEFVGMGSTMAGIAVDGYTISVVNVGDSRLYLIRDGAIEQLSVDHTLAEEQVERGLMTPQEAQESELKHILSSVLGVEPELQSHVDELAVLPGDLFLLCTDGLTGVMKDEEILDEVLKDEPGPHTLERLITEVNARGGPDNITLALTVFLSEPDGSR
jgi:PPM family protein phosphatase